MIASFLIAFAAGAASALMFASLVSGALISLLLFYLAPLPLMVAALGWSPLSAAIGGIAAGAALGMLFGIPYLAVFVVTVALPAWWLGYVALLGRPAAATPAATDGVVTTTPVTKPATEWYPVGRLLLWIAAFASFTTAATLLTLGTDSDTLVGAMKGMLKQMLVAMQTSRDRPLFTDVDKAAEALAMVAPAIAAIVAIITLTLNTWLAGRITVTSGRLRRPWPSLQSAALPPMTLVGLCVAIALSFTGGLIGIFAQIVSSALLIAYALTGFAALHTLTTGMKGRTVVLSMIYAMVLMLGWPVLTMIALGLADAFFGFRQRFLARRPPPTTVA